MTREEIIKLLEIVSAAYPYAMNKIGDPAALVTAWEMGLGMFSAESVYKAARLHIESSQFFPTVADIREKMVRASIAYDMPPVNSLEAHAPPKYDKELDDFCRWVGFGCEPDDSVELPKGFLPYEQ